MKRIYWLTALLIFLAACAAGGNEPPVESETVENEAATAVLTTTIPTTIPTNTATITRTAVAPSAAPSTEKPETPTATAQTGAVMPITVDLSQITPPGTAVATTPQVIPAPGVRNSLTALINQVSQDLAQRLKIDVSEVSLVEAFAVDWSDGSLGCPQPGMGYLTVITPGFQITLAVQGEVYTYHTDQGRYFVLCGEDGRPVP